MPITTSNKHGNQSINLASSQSLPRLGGNVNYIRLLQYTPGVAASTEGSGNIMVRGGDYGQNRTTLNGAPLYTPSHLLGFASTINSAHLNKLTLIKSNIPAEYGSAASSIIDIQTHSHIPEHFSTSGNLGIIGSDLAVQIPLGDRVAIFASARRSYVSWLANHINLKDASMAYEFYDYDVGVVADLGKAGLLTINTHFNQDEGAIQADKYNGDGNFGWWNGVGSASLNTNLAENIVMTNTLYASLYDNSINISLAGNNVEMVSGIGDYGLRNITTVKGEQSTIAYGLDYAYRNITPQYVYSEEHYNAIIKTDKTHEIAAFASAEWRPIDKLEIYSGLRMGLYLNGKHWFYPEPRLMLTIPFNSQQRAWASYNTMVQYLQLIPQSKASLATDFYIGAAQNYEPQRSHNFSVGYKHSDVSGSLTLSAELFYRRMFGVIEFDKLITHVLDNNYNYDKYLHTGEGEAYGAELSLSYLGKDYSVRANYTIGRSLRQIDDFNEGRVYPAHSDRRHTLSVLTTYDPSPRWALSATFIYATGAPYTAPIAIYLGKNTLIKEYSSYNGMRLPAIHHLDISVSYNIPSKRLQENSINLSLYNVYAQKNPLMISWDVSYGEQDSNTVHVTKRYHYLYTLIPSLSWIFKF